jgi:RimJ/RimL family protein N-acetyltransferase
MIDSYVARQISANDDDRASFIIAIGENLRAVGEVVINDVDHDNHSANIRIGLFSEQDFNKGYGTEAMQLMVDYGFKILNLHRISLGVYAFNPRAIRVYEKIGFKQEGILRDALYWDGKYVDGITMSILAHEWQN